MLERSVVEECCREVLEKSVVEKSGVVEKCWRRVLEKIAGEECCREVLKRSVVEKCCGEVL